MAEEEEFALKLLSRLDKAACLWMRQTAVELKTGTPCYASPDITSKNHIPNTRAMHKHASQMPLLQTEKRQKTIVMSMLVHRCRIHIISSRP